MSAHPSDPSLSGRATHGISAAATLVSRAEDLAPARGDRLARGAMVGRYIVLDLLGRGGMGVVYTAYDPELDRKVALKLLLPGRDRRPEARLRLQREAQAIARLSHPNVVAVHDVGTVGDRVFIAMEFIDGTDLARWLHQASREPAQVLATYLQAGEGLAAAHAAGLAHRDFKPENVLLGVDGRARVVDFGLVREDQSVASRADEGPIMVDASQRRLESSAVVDVSQRRLEGSAVVDVSQRRLEGSDIRLTDAGTLVGTPAYMSPEQFMGRSGDARSDQFSFCVALYEGLYGERPFAGEDVAELSMTVLDGEVRAAPASSRVPGRLRRVLLRGLAHAPEDRYPGMPALLAALRKASAPRRRWWWIVPAALGLGGVGALAATQARPDDPSCDGGEARRQAIWDQPRQVALERAFVQTGVPYASDTWARVQARIDRRLAHWVELDRQVCEQNAGFGPGAAAEDPRRRCLEETLAQTADMLAVFERAQASTVMGAVAMTHALRTMDDCLRFDAAASFPLPSDPALAESVGQVRSELQRWRLQTSAAGHDESTSEQLEALSERAAELAYRPLDGEILRARSALADEDGRLDEAVELSNRAFEVALEARYDRLAFELAASLLFAHGVQRREPIVGDRWGRRARAFERRMGDDPERHVQLMSNWAAVLTVNGEDERAREYYDEALATARTLDSPMHQATVLNNIGSFHAQRGQHALALDYLQEAAALNEDLFGPDHPTTLRTTANLGLVSIMDGKLEDGLAQLQDVMPRQEAVLGARSVELLTTLEGMGSALTRLERYQDALAIRRRAIEMRESFHGPAHPLTLAAHNNLANTLLEMEDYAQALPQLTAIMPLADALPESEISLKVNVLNNLAIAVAKRAEPGPEAEAVFAESLAHAERAYRLCQSTEHCPSHKRASMSYSLGWAALRSGDRALARESFARLVDEPRAHVPTWMWVGAQRGLALTRFDDDRETALSEARRALADLETKHRDDLQEDSHVRDAAGLLREWIAEPEPFDPFDAKE